LVRDQLGARSATTPKTRFVVAPDIGREVKLGRVDSVLTELSYPVDMETAAGELANVTVTFADGERNLGELVAETPADEYASFEEFRDEINNTVPREVVGEPYQSEGEG
jgi:hypothetical protein